MIAVLSALALLIVCIAAACSGWKNPPETGQTGERLRRKLKAKKVPASWQTQQKGRPADSSGTTGGSGSILRFRDRQAYQISPAYQPVRRSRQFII